MTERLSRERRDRPERSCPLARLANTMQSAATLRVLSLHGQQESDAGTREYCLRWGKCRSAHGIYPSADPGTGSLYEFEMSAGLAGQTGRAGGSR